MSTLFEIEDYRVRKVCLRKKDWLHISFFHPEVSVEEIKDAIICPTSVKPSVNSPESVKCYYRYNKVKKRYLLAAVKCSKSEAFWHARSFINF